MVKPKVGESSKSHKPHIGRKKGTPNKVTAMLKDAILMAAEQAGNEIGKDGLVSYLEKQATDNPGPFMSLLGKILPMQISGEIVGTIKAERTADEISAAIESKLALFASRQKGAIANDDE